MEVSLYNRTRAVIQSIFITGVVFVLALLTNIIIFEWYVILSFLAGGLILTDLLKIVRNPEFLKDPFFYADIILIFDSFFAPVFHSYTGVWLAFLSPPDDWTPYANTLSLMYFSGLVLFFISKNILLDFSYSLGKKKSRKKVWLPSRKSLTILFLLMIGSFFLQTYFYTSLGGIKGYISHYGEEDRFSGYGLFFIFSEIFPLIFLLSYFIISRFKKIYTTKLVSDLFLVVLFLSCLYFGGLRGSRSNTIFTILQAWLLIHLTVRKFTKREFFIAISLFCLFMYFGNLYKRTRGEFVLNNFSVEQQLENSGFEQIIANNLSRYSIQGYLIYKYEPMGYQPKYGKIYLGDVMKYLPSQSLKEIYLDKRKAGTEIISGTDAWNYGDKTSRVFGFMGESILNWGPLLAPFMFILLAYVLYKLRKYIFSLDRNDIRLFLVPLIINMVFILVHGDLDNVVFFVIKRIIPMYVVLSIISNKVYLQSKPSV